MMTLVTGGAKCGKSHYAEQLLENFAGKKFYIATMEPYGEEAMAAISRHRKLRAGKGFETIERYTDIDGLAAPEDAEELADRRYSDRAYEGKKNSEPVFRCAPADCGYEEEGKSGSVSGRMPADCEYEEEGETELISACASADCEQEKKRKSGLRLPRGCGILLECTANLCANEMFRDGRICDPTEKILRGFRRLKEISAELVIVTNEVGSDGISYEEGTAEYIRVLGTVNRLTAQMADRVVEYVYGIPVVRKQE